MLFFLILSISIIAKAKSGGPLPLDHGPVRGYACRRSEGIQETVKEPSGTELLSTNSRTPSSKQSRPFPRRAYNVVQPSKKREPIPTTDSDRAAATICTRSLSENARPQSSSCRVKHSSKTNSSQEGLYRSSHA